MEIVLTAVAPLLLLAVLTEAVTEQLKKFVPSADERTKQLLSFAIGIIFAAVLQISLFAQATGAVHVAGIILAGLICSRGSNYVHDFVGMIAAAKATIEQQ